MAIKGRVQRMTTHHAKNNIMSLCWRPRLPTEATRDHGRHGDPETSTATRAGHLHSRSCRAQCATSIADAAETRAHISSKPSASALQFFKEPDILCKMSTYTQHHVLWHKTRCEPTDLSQAYADTKEHVALGATVATMSNATSRVPRPLK